MTVWEVAGVEIVLVAAEVVAILMDIAGQEEEQRRTIQEPKSIACRVAFMSSRGHLGSLRAAFDKDVRKQSIQEESFVKEARYGGLAST